MLLNHELIHFRLKEPFSNHRGNIFQIHQVLITLQWNQFEGNGSAVLKNDEITSNLELQTHLELIKKILKDSSPYEAHHLLNRIECEFPNQPALLSGIDLALFDLLGKATNLPLNRLLGISGSIHQPTSLSIGVMPERELFKRIESLRNWPILKLKMAQTSNIRMISQIREIYSGRIWIDGNGSWDINRTSQALDEFHDTGVELLEQPIPAGSPLLLKSIREYSPIPIIADEDCKDLKDILSLNGCVDGVNIKLVKCGGLRRAQLMIQLARTLGLKVMLGCKTESVLGVSAMAHLASLADYLDLDGHLDLLDDAFQGIQVKDGQFFLSKAPGIGAMKIRGTHL